MKVAGVFGGVFLAVIATCFFAMMNQYHRAVARHEFLLEIFQNPKAKVVPNHRAQEFIEHKKL